jgi:hypothetical protein
MSGFSHSRVNGSMVGLDITVSGDTSPVRLTLALLSQNVIKMTAAVISTGVEMLSKGQA